jgi:hypothetical protein
MPHRLSMRDPQGWSAALPRNVTRRASWRHGACRWGFVGGPPLPCVRRGRGGRRPPFALRVRPCVRPSLWRAGGRWTAGTGVVVTPVSARRRSRRLRIVKTGRARARRRLPKAGRGRERPSQACVRVMCSGRLLVCPACDRRVVGMAFDPRPVRTPPSLAAPRAAIRMVAHRAVPRARAGSTAGGGAAVEAGRCVILRVRTWPDPDPNPATPVARGTWDTVRRPPGPGLEARDRDQSDSTMHSLALSSMARRFM